MPQIIDHRENKIVLLSQIECGDGFMYSGELCIKTRRIQDADRTIEVFHVNDARQINLGADTPVESIEFEIHIVG